jgi:hypothetical protein
MFRSVTSRSLLVIGLGTAIAISGAPADAQSQDKSFDVRSSVGDLHLGKDADAQAAGFALYPGARPKREENNDPVNFGILTEGFGFKIVVAKYESDDAPAKVLAFYRDKLKKYGKVLECHTSEHGGDAHVDDNGDKHSKELKCDGDNTGSVTELKVGSEDNQHVIAAEPRDGHSGTTFTLVYVYARGKHGDI